MLVAMRITKLTLLALLCPLILPGCHRTPRRPERHLKPRPAPVKVDLPRLVRPDPVAAARVVNVLYTTNVVGDAEPCG